MNSNSTQQLTEKNLKPDPNFISLLAAYCQERIIPEKYKNILEQFYFTYKEALENDSIPINHHEKKFVEFLKHVREQFQSPYVFQPYHEAIRTPYDYYSFGVEFLRPLVDKTVSTLEGKENIRDILSHLQKGHNVILLANHQIEADPQAISLLLEDFAPELGEKMIFVAGERVVTDPLAIPFSMGRNLLCIYSKRYIDHPPEHKLKKQLHNKRTMQLMSELLSEGGKCIYVAPSGGRDRRNEQGIVEVAPFDPQSIEMFYLMAQKAEKPTLFYPLALLTYDMLPPPEMIQIELGEVRHAKRCGIHLSFGKQIDMEKFPGCELKDKHERRRMRAEYICNLVRTDYKKMQKGNRK
jgi:glycerol-3-phosphate O-acyltransferase